MDGEFEHGVNKLIDLEFKKLQHNSTIEELEMKHTQWETKLQHSGEQEGA